MATPVSSFQDCLKYPVQHAKNLERVIDADLEVFGFWESPIDLAPKVIERLDDVYRVAGWQVELFSRGRRIRIASPEAPCAATFAG